MNYFLRVLFFLILFPVIVFGGNTPIVPHTKISDKLSFKENKGQWYNKVKYLGEIPGGNIFLEQQGFTYELVNGDDIAKMHPYRGPLTVHGHVYKVDFLGSNSSAALTTDGKSEAYYNYFLGKDPSHWAHDVHAFNTVTYNSLYPGIDMKVYGKNYTLKYDLIVHSGGKTSDIQFKYRGADKLCLHQDNLVIQTSVGEVVEVKPYAYQIINGEEQEVPCKYNLSPGNVLSFSFPNGYNKDADLIIDPTLIFATYTGSTADNWGWTATYDAQGDLYLGGYVNAIDFFTGQATGIYPTTTGTFQLAWAGGTGGQNGSGNGIGYACDMGITKFNPTGTSLIYSTYLGGSDNECPHSLFVNSLGELCVYGDTYSKDYPVTKNAYDTSYNGSADIVVTVFNTTGTALIGSTYVGGSGADAINYDATEGGHGNLKVNYGDNARGEIVCDAQDNIYVATSTSSSDFPVTAGCAQPTIGGQQDACVFKLNHNCSSLVYSTYLGGSLDDAAYSIDVAPDNSLYIAGGTMSTNFPSTNNGVNKSFLGGNDDGFVVHLNAAGTALVNTTFVGTSADDQTYCVKLDAGGNVYVMGNTNGRYPVTAGVYINPNSGQYITKFNPALNTVIYSTVFGNGSGQPNISPTAFLVDTCENIYVAGWGNSASSVFSTYFTFPSKDMTNMPLTPDAVQSTTDGTDFYIIVLKKDAQSLLYGTYYGGDETDEHVDGGTSRFDKNGVIYEAICASCGNHGKEFPMTDGGTPTTAGVWSETNQSNNCNELALKLDMNFIPVKAKALANPAAIGCQPLHVQFVNNSLHATQYFWSFGTGKKADTSTQFEPTFTFLDTGTFKVMLVASNPNSCKIHDTAYTSVVVFNTVIKATTVAKTTDYCDSVNVKLTGTSNGKATRFYWNFGDGTTSNLPSPSHTYYNPGIDTIILTIRDTFSCNGFDTTIRYVTVQPRVHGKISDSAYVGCPPFTVDFNPHYTDIDSVLWNFGDTTFSSLKTPNHTYVKPGTYKVKLTTVNLNTCNKRDSSFISVIVKAPIITTMVANSTDLCDSVVAQLGSKSTGTATKYYWNFGDSTNSSLANPGRHVYYKSGNYTITLYTDDSLACNPFDTLIQKITVQKRVSVQIINATDTGCAPLTIFFKDDVVNADSILWNFGDGTFSTLNDPTHTYSKGGTYNISLVGLSPDLCNHSDSSFGTVLVYPKPPVADFTISPSADEKLGTTFTFINYTKGGSTYLWGFGDGDSSHDFNTQHYYKKSGDYTVCLTVNYNFPCPDSLCKGLRVEPPQSIGVPNAFTPNGDGQNDILYVRGERVTTLLFKVFNRWGEKVFETNDLNIGWDGIYKGKPQEMDVYTWELFATMNDGQKVVQSGNVSLIR